jgi:hypothetical protein
VDRHNSLLIAKRTGAKNMRKAGASQPSPRINDRHIDGWQAALTLLAAVSLFTIHAHAFAGSIGSGTAQQIASVDGVELPVFTYRPAGCAPQPLLLVFHGVGRDGGPYRDHARSLADRVCAIVVAPQFDHKRFPRDDYQYGGVTFAASNASPLARRTVDLIPALVSWAQDAAAMFGSPQAVEALGLGGSSWCGGLDLLTTR